jgi:hypothetical protein
MVFRAAPDRVYGRDHRHWTSLVTGGSHDQASARQHVHLGRTDPLSPFHHGPGGVELRAAGTALSLSNYIPVIARARPGNRSNGVTMFGRLTFVLSTLAALSLLLYTIGAPHTHGG